MSDESKLLASVARAQAMKEWAEGENGFFDLMDVLERAWTEALLTTEPPEAEMREALYNRIQAGRDIVQSMRIVINGGKPAEAELERLKAVEDGERREFH